MYGISIYQIVYIIKSFIILVFYRTHVINMKIRVGKKLSFQELSFFIFTVMNTESERRSEENACISFQTAWSAPHPVIEKTVEMFPDVQIMHRWADSFFVLKL